MIVVTGGAGFIGSNLIAALNLRGRRDVILVDDLSDTAKIQNISDLTIADYIDKDHFQKIVNISVFARLRRFSCRFLSEFHEIL